MATTLHDQIPGRSRSLAGRRLGRGRWVRLGRDPGGWLGLGLVVLVLALALAGPLLAPADPNAIDLPRRNHPPAWMAGGTPDHLLGADPLGRDLLSRLLHGARLSLTVALGVTAASASLGVVAGAIAGYVGGWRDQLLVQVTDLLLAFPFILLAMIILAVAGPGLATLLLALVVTGWTPYARLARGQVLSVKHAAYIEAARVIGAGDGHILTRHVLPNVIAPAVVLASLRLASVILSEAALSFLGLAVASSTPTWGAMVSDGRPYIYTAWWVITLPGLAITLTVVGTNLVGDWLRDHLDPTVRTGG